MRSIHHGDGHLGWDATNEPRLHVAPGDEFEVVLADCFDGQLGSDAVSSHVPRIDLARANPLTGPVAVEGAAPGDGLSVRIVDLELAAIGWTVIPPRRVGGNLDCRDVAPGATLALPVEVPGALLSVGDPHGTQGDGEVCGTAVETSAVARLRVDVSRDREPPAPQLLAPPAEPRVGGQRWLTTGVGPDLYQGARDATRAMIERLGTERGVEAADAYALCSVAADLRIVEVVDAPNWVVACELDSSVLEDR